MPRLPTDIRNLIIEFNTPCPIKVRIHQAIHRTRHCSVCSYWGVDVQYLWERIFYMNQCLQEL